MLDGSFVFLIFLSLVIESTILLAEYALSLNIWFKCLLQYTIGLSEPSSSDSEFFSRVMLLSLLYSVVDLLMEVLSSMVSVIIKLFWSNHDEDLGDQFVRVIVSLHLSRD